MTCVEINQCVRCTNKSSLSHLPATTRLFWLGRAVRNRHRHAIEQASRRWRGGQRGDSGRTRRKFDFHTGKDYEYAWCVEHDVALTGGNWLGLFQDHASDSRDLLAWRVGWVPKDAKPHKGGAWNAGMMTGPRFDCFQNGRGGWPFSTCHGGHSEVAILFGAIVRYSSRFASLLDQDGAADPPSYGHSETAVPTLCNITQWCTMGNISAAWVGINRCRNRISGALRLSP